MGHAPEYRSVSYWSKEIDDAAGGRKKLFFLIRDIDDAAMAGASVESCRLAAQSLPEVVLGRYCAIAYAAYAAASKLKMRAPAASPIGHDLPKISIQRCWGAPSTPHAAEATTRPQTYPRGSPRADLHPKKVNNLGPMAPRSVKNVNYPRAPSSRRSAVSLDPILPQR